MGGACAIIVVGGVFVGWVSRLALGTVGRGGVRSGGLVRVRGRGTAGWAGAVVGLLGGDLDFQAWAFGVAGQGGYGLGALGLREDALRRLRGAVVLDGADVDGLGTRLVLGEFLFGSILSGLSGCGAETPVLCEERASVSDRGEDASRFCSLRLWLLRLKSVVVIPLLDFLRLLGRRC